MRIRWAALGKGFFLFLFFCAGPTEAEPLVADPWSNNLYRRLGADPSMTRDELKKKWNKCAVRFHTDTGSNEAAFKQCNDAWETLGDDDRRAAYDRRMGINQTKVGGAGTGGAAAALRWEPQSFDNDFYTRLGVTQNATYQDFAAAWSVAYQEYERAGRGHGSGRFYDIAEAWELLRYPDERAAYDVAMIAAEAFRKKLRALRYDPDLVAPCADFFNRLSAKLRVLVAEAQKSFLYTKISAKYRKELLMDFFRVVERDFVPLLMRNEPTLEKIFTFHYVLSLFNDGLEPFTDDSNIGNRLLVSDVNLQTRITKSRIWRAYRETVSENKLWSEALRYLRPDPGMTQRSTYRTHWIIGSVLTQHDFPRGNIYYVVRQLFPAHSTRFLEVERGDVDLMEAALKTLLEFIEDDARGYITSYLSNQRTSGYTDIYARQWMEKALDSSLKALGIIRAQWRRFPAASLHAETVLSNINKWSGLNPDRWETESMPGTERGWFWSCERASLIKKRAKNLKK